LSATEVELLEMIDELEVALDVSVELDVVCNEDVEEELEIDEVDELGMELVIMERLDVVKEPDELLEVLWVPCVAIMSMPPARTAITTTAATTTYVRFNQDDDRQTKFKA
jgi:hypothetical protein